eukprot:gb/GECG01016083.1/.p1 GENE.gb/GECG01016083.1/~~gb/GECG01016083.1/.p1  ORF type:complete len:160 (+),score=37.02 gb/GECG01016083.1/:1-480(+)
MASMSAEKPSTETTTSSHGRVVGQKREREEQEQQTEEQPSQENEQQEHKHSAADIKTIYEQGNRNSEGEMSWALSGKKKATVRQFQGKTLIDIREFYQKDGEEKPGRKGKRRHGISSRKGGDDGMYGVAGISLTVEQFKKLKEIMPALESEAESLEKRS